MSENLEGQVVYWRQKVNADPAMLDQVIRAMLLARQTQAKAEADAKKWDDYDAKTMDVLKTKLAAATARAEAAEAMIDMIQQALDAGLQVHLMPSGPDYTVEIVGDDKGIEPYIKSFAVESTFADALNSALRHLARYTRV